MAGMEGQRQLELVSMRGRGVSADAAADEGGRGVSSSRGERTGGRGSDYGTDCSSGYRAEGSRCRRWNLLGH